MRPNSGPLGWDEAGLAAQPENRRGAPPGWATGRPGARPFPPAEQPDEWAEETLDAPPYGPPQGRAPAPLNPRGYAGGWEDEALTGRSPSRPLPETARNIDTNARGGRRPTEREPEVAERRSEEAWENDYRWGATDGELLTLSGAFNALLGAAIGGLPGGVIWLVAVIFTGLSLPYLTVLVGLLAGLGARFALVQTRPWSLGFFAMLGAAVAYVVTQYGLFDSALVRQGGADSWFPLSLVHFVTVYIDYVIGVADDVTRPLGVSGTHPLEPLWLLVCMGACWLVLLRRKR